MFSGRTLIIATMHGKEKVLGPVLAEGLGVKPRLAAGLNTDRFGTFSGEIKREGTALETARRKCRAALELNGESLALASEGSFGAHPLLFGVAANEEWLLLLDAENELEIWSRVLSLETNYASQVVASETELEAFAQEAGFPEHGVLLKTESGQLLKELTDWPQLLAAYRQLAKGGRPVTAETDMRAHRNPTRQKAIAEAAKKLVERAKTHCPACQQPGFGPTDSEAGLPCDSCGSATQSVLYLIHSCQGCGHQHKERVAQATESPEYCPWCNP